MIAKVYRRIFPEQFRQAVYWRFLRRVLHFGRGLGVQAKGWHIIVSKPLKNRSEEDQLYVFMAKHGVISTPYRFSLEYKRKEVLVSRESDDFPFVEHHGKRLYFPASFTNAAVRHYYRSLTREQDARSPHRYVEDYGALDGRVVLDIGAAEGIFALDAVEHADHIYIVECGKEWQGALDRTFAPWGDRISVISSFVGDKIGDGYTTIDEIMSGVNAQKLFIKMDIEGAEQDALAGMADTLRKTKNIMMAVCAYHKKHDATQICETLNPIGFSCEFTDGMMFYEKDLRIGLVRATRQ